MLIYQSNYFDCGFACLKMLLVDIHKDKNYRYLKNVKHNKEYSLADIISIAKSYGVVLKAFRLSSKEDVLKEKTSFMAVMGQKSPHMIYVKKITAKKVLVYDPDDGKHWVKKSDFLFNFNGIILQVMSFAKMPSPCRKKTIVSTFKRIVFLVFQALSLCSLFVAFYFIKETIFYLIPIAFFAIAFVFQVAEMILVSSTMKKFDEKYLHFCQNGNYYKNKDTLERIQSMKKCIFSTPLNIISALSCIAFVAITLIINSPVNIALIGTVFIGYFLFYYLVVHYEMNKRENIDKLEEKFLRGDTEAGNPLLKNTYNLVLIFNIKKVMAVVLSLISSLILMYLSSDSSLNFCLLYFFFYLTLINNYEKALDVIFLRKDRKKVESFFIDLME